MKAKRFPFLPVLLALGTAGCDVDPAAQTIQRDVYTRMEDCVADWGNQDLCKQMEMAEEKSGSSKEASAPVRTGGSFIYIHGPGYYGSDRAVTHGGQIYRATGAARPVSVSSFSRAGAFLKSGPVSRGGFGVTGVRAGGAMSGG